MAKNLPEKVIKEHFEKEQRLFKVYDHYIPNYKQSSVSTKFYSKYDALDLSQADDDIVFNIKKYRDKGPKDKTLWPVTQNQWYGWFSTPLVKLNLSDERKNFPVKEHPDTKHEIKLKGDQTMKLEKFTGVPFKL